MAILLSIDTATEDASVCISADANILAIEKSSDQKNHAGFIHAAIQHMLEKCELTLNQVDAIAVTEGPGSYTGLRVGMATAKGLCFAAQKPLITVNTLAVMAKAAIDAITNDVAHTLHQQAEYAIQPMIDARRMEVFTAVYDNRLQMLHPPEALVIDETVEQEWKSYTKPIVFIGSGSKKITQLVYNLHHIFIMPVVHDASHLATLAQQKFEQKSFSDLAYSEPFYLKQFFSTAKKA